MSGRVLEVAGLTGPRLLVHHESELVVDTVVEEGSDQGGQLDTAVTDALGQITRFG